MLIERADGYRVGSLSRLHQVPVDCTRLGDD
jgi:hypothetical protein